MNCLTCDAPLEPGVLFCANCGARVATQPSSVAPTIVLPPTDDTAPAAPPQQWAAPTPASSNTPQPYTPLQPYAPPQPDYAMVSLPTSGAATVSLIFGILAYVFLPFIGAIVAVIAGHMARNEIRASGGKLGGGGLATAGLVLGYIQIVLLVLIMCAIIAIGVLTLLGSRVR